MMYERPNIIIMQADLVLLAASGPGATSIGSPSVDDDAKEFSVWDEVDTHYNIKEKDYEVYD